MRLRTLLSTTLIGAALAFSACGGGASKVKIDATDAVTLDGTFRESIEGLGQADQMKAAAGLLMLAYEGTGDDNRPMDYVEEAKEEAFFLLDANSGNVFQSRGAVLNEIAKESNGVLDGKTAQDLIDHYNITTGQYDEYLKDQEEAEAAKKAQKAAAAETARMSALGARRDELKKMQAELSDAVSANKAKRSALKKARDAAAAKRDALQKKQKSMAGNVTPANTLSRSGANIRGHVQVIIINKTDTPIMNPVVKVVMTPKGQAGNTLTSKAAGLYKFEFKGKPLAPGASSEPLDFPVSYKGVPESSSSQGRKVFSGDKFEAYLVGYQRPDKSKVSLTLDAETQSILNNYEAAVAKCSAADKAIANAKTSIPAAIKALDAPDADPKKMPKLGSTRC